MANRVTNRCPVDRLPVCHRRRAGTAIGGFVSTKDECCSFNAELVTGNVRHFESTKLQTILTLLVGCVSDGKETCLNVGKVLNEEKPEINTKKQIVLMKC